MHVQTQTPTFARTHTSSAALHTSVHADFGSLTAERFCKGAETQAPSSTSPENPQALGVWEGEPDALCAGGTVESMTQVDLCREQK